MRLLLLSLGALILLSGVVVLILTGEGENKETAGLTVASVMSGAERGFEKADSVRRFSFPADHFAHPAFRTEWWYFTGNLFTGDGRRFGYQVTIFRNGIFPVTKEDTSGFSASAVYSAHIGVSDISTGKFFSFESFARGSNGLGGSNIDSSTVFAGSVSLKFDFTKDPAMPLMKISAKKKDLELELELFPLKPAVLQGNKGLSAKSNKPGNASYYYSYTRLATKAVFGTGGERIELKGHSWMDREWSTSALDEDQKGWDWFALQLNDNTELMYFRLRDATGNTNFQKGSLVFADGSYTVLRENDLKFSTLELTTVHGTRYPNSWKIEVIPVKTSFEVKTAMKNQEHRFTIRYYEGAIDAEKVSNGTRTPGRGYVELTGYSGQ